MNRRAKCINYFVRSDFIRNPRAFVLKDMRKDQRTIGVSRVLRGSISGMFRLMCKENYRYFNRWAERLKTQRMLRLIKKKPEKRIKPLALRRLK